MTWINAYELNLIQDIIKAPMSTLSLITLLVSYIYIYIYIRVLYIDKYILNIEIFLFNNSCSLSFIFHILQRNWTSNWYIIKLSICVTKVKYQRFSMKNSRTSPAALFCCHYLPRRTPDKHMGLGNSFFVYITQETEATFPKREISPNVLVFVSTA